MLTDAQRRFFFFHPKGLSSLLAGAALLVGLSACQPKADAGGDASVEDTPPSTVEMTMADYAFGVPDSIPSGWVTFQMENVGEETHEFTIHRLPEGKTFEDVSEYRPPLDSLEQLLIEGAIDSTEHQEAVQRVLPEWFGEIEGVGAGGLLGPGQTARATLKLEPGRYVMNCFISSPNGRTHAFQGMARPITVTEAGSGAKPPEANVTIRSVGREISFEGPLRSGKQTVALRVEEPREDLESQYSWAFLAPLSPGTSAEELRERDFTDEEVHATEFQGGVGAVPPGQTRYFTADLEPGRYAWVLYNSDAEDLVKEFTVE